MKLLVSWLRDFVDVTIPADELGRMLSMRGFELAAVEPAPPPASSDDAIIDLEITANRPDCAGGDRSRARGGHDLDRPLRRASRTASAPLRLAALDVGTNERVRVVLEDAALCPRYAAAVAEVTVGPSPAWLVARLHAAGYPTHQQRGRHHQLRPDGARPADARVRPREACRAAKFGSGARRVANQDASTASTGC